MIILVLAHIALFCVTLKSIVQAIQTKGKNQNYLFVYLTVTFLCEFSALVMDFFSINQWNGLQYNLYVMFCIFFFTYFYLRLLTNKIRHAAILVFVLTLAYIIVQTRFYEQEFDVKIGVSFAMYSILLSLLWFYQKLMSISISGILDDANFWVSTAILMWSCFFLFRVVPMYFLYTKDKEFLTILKTILDTVNIIMYIFFFMALLKYKQNFTNTQNHA